MNRVLRTDAVDVELGSGTWRAHRDAPATEHFFDQPTNLASVWISERGTRRVEARFNWTDETTEGLRPHSVRLTAEPPNI